MASVTFKGDRRCANDCQRPRTDVEISSDPRQVAYLKEAETSSYSTSDHADDGPGLCEVGYSGCLMKSQAEEHGDTMLTKLYTSHPDGETYTGVQTNLRDEIASDTGQTFIINYASNAKGFVDELHATRAAGAVSDYQVTSIGEARDCT